MVFAPTMVVSTIILSDLHLGRTTRAAVSPESIASLCAPFDRVVLNGDVYEAHHPALKERGTEAWLNLQDQLVAAGCDLIPIAGNHDGPSPLAILREAIVGPSGWGRPVSRTTDRVDALRRALGAVQLGGYSLHKLGELSVLAARPFAMDHRHLSFASILRKRHSVGSLHQSRDRLCALVDRVQGPYLILSHNGPHGLGTHRGAPYALNRLGRDNGDRDLAEAIRYAIECDRAPLAVVSGHMHHNARKPRAWKTHHRGVLCINAARVPRHERSGERHLVRLTVQPGRVTARAEIYRAP